MPSDSSCAITGVQIGNRVELATLDDGHRSGRCADTDDRYCVGFESRLREQNINMLVEEPGAVTPIFMPFRSAGDL